MGKAGDIRIGQIIGPEYPAKELKLLPEFLHGSQAKVGPSISVLT